MGILVSWTRSIMMERFSGLAGGGGGEAKL